VPSRACHAPSPSRARPHGVALRASGAREAAWGLRPRGGARRLLARGCRWQRAWPAAGCPGGDSRGPTATGGSAVGCGATAWGRSRRPGDWRGAVLCRSGRGPMLGPLAWRAALLPILRVRGSHAPSSAARGPTGLRKACGATRGTAVSPSGHPARQAGRPSSDMRWPGGPCVRGPRACPAAAHGPHTAPNTRLQPTPASVRFAPAARRG
jgi:hypothetical protein